MKITQCCKISWIDFKAMWKTVCVYRPLVVTDVTTTEKHHRIMQIK